MNASIPEQLPQRLLVAIPDDGSPLIAIGTRDHCEFNEYLRRLGVDPEHCAIGHAEHSVYEIAVSWDRTVRIEA